MTPLSKWIDTVLSALAGIVLGQVFGYYGWILLVVLVGDGGRNGDWTDVLIIMLSWINVLLTLLPVIFGAFLVATVWLGRWRGVRRITQGLALIAGFWQLYLMAT